MGQDNQLGWLKQLVESGARVRLAPGIIGKSTMMWLPLILGWIVVIVRLSDTNPWLNVEMLAGVVVLTLAIMRETGKMRAYAEANPATALLEGAELLAWKKHEASAKGLLDGDKSPPAAAPGSRVMKVTDPEGPLP